MRISSLEVVGLRSIARAKITFSDVTALIGGNNAGKSTLLHALRLFFEAAPKVSKDDFHKREMESIEIVVTFDQLTPDEIKEFGSAVNNDQITISRTLSEDKEKNLTYSVRARTYPAFAAIRAETNKNTMRAAFNALADQTEGLDRANNADQVLDNMDKWEKSHPDLLEFSYVRGFFGAPNVANGKLKKKTNLHFIPAVVNVSDETSDTKRSPIIGLLSDIAKQTYENREEVKKFIEKTQSDFDELVDTERFPELGKISESLTAAIKRYYSESSLIADWRSEESIQFRFPQPTIQVEDGGFVSGLEHVGHGLQRAALFSVIEFLAQNRFATTEEEFVEAQSDIILLIEEPEIYQHPHKQKIVSDAFRNICQKFSSSTGIRFQIIFATHSEKFVDIQNFNQARIIRKIENSDQVEHNVSFLEINECSKYFAGLVKKKPMPDHAFIAKLHIFSREMCEGFFAKKIILVEGVTDKAILEGVYRAAGRDNIAEGIVIISAEGKTKMDKPFYIFNKLGIPTYAVFDSDANSRDKKPRANRWLQIIAGNEQPDDYPSGCHGRYAAFEWNLEAYTKKICGEGWQNKFQEVADEFGLDISDICKTPQAASRVMEKLRESGETFPMFDGVVIEVDQLASW